MDKEELSLEDLRELVLEGGLDQFVAMVMTDNEIVQQLALAVQLHRHSRMVKRSAKRLRAMATEPEHRELADAMRDAVRGAEVAFDAALAATWQLYWLGEHCNCEACVQDRRREHAEHN
jgi:hypothetical protein